MKVQGASIIILASRCDPYSGGEQEVQEVRVHGRVRGQADC